MESKKKKDNKKKDQECGKGLMRWFDHMRISAFFICVMSIMKKIHIYCNDNKAISFCL